MLQTSPLGWSSLLWVNSGKPIKLLHRTTTFPNVNMLIIWSCSYILRIFPFNLSPKIIKLYSQNYRFKCFTTCLYCSISVNCVLVLLLPPSNWRSVFVWWGNFFHSNAGLSNSVEHSANRVNILLEPKKQKESKQAGFWGRIQLFIPGFLLRAIHIPQFQPAPDKHRAHSAFSGTNSF